MAGEENGIGKMKFFLGIIAGLALAIFLFRKYLFCSCDYDGCMPDAADVDLWDIRNTKKENIH